MQQNAAKKGNGGILQHFEISVKCMVERFFFQLDAKNRYSWG